MKKIFTLFLVMCLTLGGSLGFTYAAQEERGSIGKLFDFLEKNIYNKTENGNAIQGAGEFRLDGKNIKDDTVSSYELQDNIEIKSLKGVGNTDIVIKSPMVLNKYPTNNTHVVNKSYVDNILSRVNSRLKTLAEVLGNITKLIANINLKISNIENKMGDIKNVTNNNSVKIDKILAKLEELEKNGGLGGAAGKKYVYKSDGTTKIGEFLEFNNAKLYISGEEKINEKIRYLGMSDYHGSFISIKGTNFTKEGITYKDEYGNIKKIAAWDREGTPGLHSYNKGEIYYGNSKCSGRKYFKPRSMHSSSGNKHNDFFKLEDITLTDGKNSFIFSMRALDYRTSGYGGHFLERNVGPRVTSSINLYNFNSSGKCAKVGNSLDKNKFRYGVRFLNNHYQEKACGVGDCIIK